MNTFRILRWHFNVWNGVHCIFDASPGIGREHFVFWMVYPVLWTVNLIFWRTFHFWGWVFDDLDDIFGIFDVDYAIWDDYLVSELIYFVLLLEYLVCWATYLIFGNTPVCILDDVFRCFRADSWAPEMYHPKTQQIIKKSNRGVPKYQICCPTYEIHQSKN